MSMLALLLLAGCVRPAPVTTAAIPPARPKVFDGSYFGDATSVPTVAPPHTANCPESREGVVEIGDERLSFAYLPQVIFNPPVPADGHFHDTVGSAVLDGRIDGNQLTMTVTTPDCTTHYALHYLGNHS